MTDPDNRSDSASDAKHGDIPGSVRMGREALSKVFRSDGGAELSSHHNTRLKKPDNDPVTGPRLLHEFADGDGSSDPRTIEGSLPGPKVQNELTDSEGPSELREMHDAEGPSELREMHDAEGPVVPRQRLEDHYYRQGKLGYPATQARIDEPSSVTTEDFVQLPGTVHLETYSIDMEDRLARVKASQKETLEKMKQLQAGQEQTVDANIEAQSILRPEPNWLNADIPVERHLLPRSSIHSAIRATVALHHRDIVDEVIHAINSHKVVVIGMGGNPFVSRARKLLRHARIEHAYLGYGNYLTGWRRRNALKMWTGWPTFPMIFIQGMLIGGHRDLQALANSGELEALLKN